jgi:putative ABC transport system substrate-binding protein
VYRQAPYASFIAAIKEGLRQTGYVEGRIVTIEYRWAEGQYDRLPQLASELVESGVAVIILVGGGATTAAAKAATATIPIVRAYFRTSMRARARASWGLTSLRAPQ